MSYENPRNNPGNWSEKVKIEGTEFSFLRRQRGDLTAIYKSGDAYMRIGDPKKIHVDLAYHKQMERAGFPVAKLLAEGEQDGQAYFIESSLGDLHLGKIFGEEVEKGGVISQETFEGFVSVAEQFARAQLTTNTGIKDYAGFAKGVLLDRMCEELPEYASKLRARFEKVRTRTEGLPFVMTHGDFNPNNLYKAGVIDLEDSFQGPFGYDLISAISHINYFPDSRDYEYFAKYRFTPEQKQEYLNRLDAISVEAGLPLLSEFEEDFEFCRALWLAANIPHTPKLQKFRYDQVISGFLS